MLHLTSSNRVCWPRAMIACHAIHHPTIYAAQGHWGHATLDVVPQFGHSKGDNVMPCPTSSAMFFIQGK